MKQFLKNNINFFIYLAISIIFELSSLFFMTKDFFITSPWLSLTLLGIVFCVYNFLGNRTFKNWVIYVAISIQIIICIFCLMLYESTGALFDYGMFQLAEEAFTFKEAIVINYGFIVYLVLLFVLFLFLTSYFNKYEDKYYRCKLSIITSSVCLVAFLISHASIIIYSNKISEKNFINSLYKDTNDKYVKFGPTANFINETYKMLFFNDYNKLSMKEIDEYIYSEVSTPTSMFGISKDNNLVTILVESFEWFSFISDPSVYPNGANLSEEDLDALYPNLRKFYNMSAVMNNHYSNNKTNISEVEALFGAYPSSNYINYGYPNNTLSSSIANTLKMQDENISNSFFHNNDITFYNRNKSSSSLGYDNLYFIDEMVENGATNYMSDFGLGGLNMNLDSEMVEVMKDEMFLTNQRFNTHITTVSMHGSYIYRENMQRWYDKIDNLGINIENDELKNYLVTVMEFDCALGLIIDDLSQKDLLDKTTIVLFSDHNTYINDLSYYVKDINSYDHTNFNELFRVPLMIYDPNIPHQIINKFTTTYDITPTILDMFGINYYTNLYYGNSIFSEKESVLYSKAFDVFIADGLYFSNINNILYKEKNISEDYIKVIENKCLALLKKIYYTNHIFDYDYFSDSSNYMTYANKFISINN